MKKKLLVLIMSGVMLGTALNSNPLCLAAEQESNTAVAYGDVDKASLTSEQIHAVNVFLENGYDESQISNFTMGFIENLAQDLESDPSKVEINTQVCSFDEVKNVEAAVNMSEEELVDKGGMSRAQAASIKKQIKSLQKMKRSDKKNNII